MKPPITVFLYVILMLHCYLIVSAQSHPDYYPLSKGSEWELKGYGTTPNITIRVVGTEKINNKVYTKIEKKYTNEQSGQNVIIYVRCEGNRVYRFMPPYDELLLFDFNIDINQSWIRTISYDDGSMGKRTGRIIDRNMSVNVPAGEFDRCIVYDITETRKTDDSINSSTYTFWLAPDVGVVKMAVTISGNAISPVDFWVNDLSSYTVLSD
ncbi:MAG: hypothetical protein JXB48_20465 [Candidatus Latescibacteria bacterium]|nr:hypothetical protein [Candidatus Latescibacterota bacterium]